MVERMQRRPWLRSRQIGYPLSLRGQVCGVQGPLLCFRSTSLYTRRLPSLGRVPVSPVPRRRQYYEGATTPRARTPGPLWFRFQAPRVPPAFVFAVALLVGVEDAARPGTLIGRSPYFRRAAPVGACGVSQVSWRSIPRLCPAPRPRPSRQDLAIDGLVDAAPGPNTPKASAAHDIEASTRLQRPLSTLQERRRRRPRKTRFRLAGCAFAGRGSNPLDRVERFQVTFHSPFQDLS
jgi:hypothetical protein